MIRILVKSFIGEVTYGFLIGVNKNGFELYFPEIDSIGGGWQINDFIFYTKP